MTDVRAETFNIDALSSVCRGCLAEGVEMKNMYEWGLSEDFNLITNVTLIRTQGISESLCLACEEALIGCKRFRTQCQRSDMLLKDIEKNKSSSQVPPNIQSQEVQIENKLVNDTLTIHVTTSNTESKIHYKCPFKCSDLFLKQNHLFTHICQFHGIDNRNFNIDVRFQCPFQNCDYNKNKHFTGRKYLNQHLSKRHSLKNIACDVCKNCFSKTVDYERHLKTCNFIFECNICSLKYKTHERLLVHLMRKHPEIHKQYKNIKKRKPEITETVTNEELIKRDKKELERKEVFDFYDSPKRSFATQTFPPEAVRNDVSLSFWQDGDRNFSNTETQTVFEDILSLKSQNSDEDYLYLSDIQTQTFQEEFGLSRKTCETQTKEDIADMCIKETQTCFCHDSPRFNFKLFDSVNSSPGSLSLTTAETQTNVRTDVLLSQSCAETQTMDENSTTDTDMD